MKTLSIGLAILMAISVAVSNGKDEEKKDQPGNNLRQFYSGKFGFYQPSDGLNNGLLVGVDGITEFIHYNFFLSAAADLYLKQTIAIFKSPSPQVDQQQMILIPLYVNAGAKLVEVADADTRVYAGAGLGYYLYFYSVNYSSSSGGGGFPFPSGALLSSNSATSNGGNFFGTIFVRFLIGKIFLEPRYYIASKREDTVNGGYSFVVNPSGYSITLGFQYH